MKSFTYFAADRALEVVISRCELGFHFLRAVGGGLSSSATARNNLVRTNSATPNSGPQDVGNAVGGRRILLGIRAKASPWDFDHRKNFEFAATSDHDQLEPPGG
ncbi:hypothetical protein BKA70DRAFT_1225012 [Coprinopsis sp. MPI-PUGE-AT-0042]|nr:hypothetical protein BKA70DRAFT_1225012 [Coprinopsis sp. MPI-PUGE-AT-0042]